MSSITGPTPASGTPGTPGAPEAPGGAARQRASTVPARSFTRQVIGDALKRYGAVLGTIYMGVLVLAAVFAPLIANSHPLLMRRAGQWSSPLLRFLTPTDVTLLVIFVAAMVLLAARRVPVGVRAATLLWIGCVTLPLAIWPTIQSNWAIWSDSWQSWSPQHGMTMLRAMIIIPAIVDGLLLIALPPIVRASARYRTVTAACAVALAALLIACPVRPPLQDVFERYRQDAAAGAIDHVIYAPLPYSPDDRLRDQPQVRLTAPTSSHPLGTTLNGADVASNMIYASRIALSIGFISTGISIVIGVIIGGLMGYYAGIVDLLGMRLVEIFSAIPTFLLMLCFVAAFGANLYILMAIIGATSWVGDAVFVRAEFLRLRQQDFVQAARACGLPLRSILFRHMLPNGMTPILVNASFGIASAILAESTLSFLGIGLTDETSWGRLLNEALGAGGTFYWWIALYPGLAIFITVFAYNLIGEALRDAIDPYLAKQV